MAPLTGLPGWMKGASKGPAAGGARAGGRFVGRNLASIASFLARNLANERYSRQPGLMQKIEPGARIYGVMALVLAGAVTQRAGVLGGLCVATALLALLSKVALPGLFRRLLPAVLFTAVLVIPVSFAFMTPGAELWGFTAGSVRVAVTREGTSSALFFILRVAAMVSPVTLLMMTTAQADFFRGLRKFPVPAFFTSALFMTFRYVFILLKISEDVNLARRSRTITGSRLAESQRWFASRAAFLLKKSIGTAEEVSMAMASRGFRGRIRTFEGARLRGWDFLWLGLTSFVFFLSLGI
ncbi:MAG: cobalt ECF transporter T component CbiQ [Thermodesulfobacteriota bacterium]